MTTPTPLRRRWDGIERTDGPGRGRGRSTMTLDGWQLSGALLLLAAAGLWLSGMAWEQRPMTSAIVLAPAAVLVGGALVSRTSRALPVPGVAGILLTGLGLRCVGLWFRYRGAADALEYHSEGIRLARAYRALDLAEPAGRTIPGTGSLRIASGVVHAVTFDDLLASFVVFTLLGFAGCLLFLRALAVAVPTADHRRYAVLVMVWPALAFWPSSLGKEAWMLLALGTTSLGAAHLLSGRWARGTLIGGGGLVLAGLVRPHVGLLALASLGVAALLRSGGRGGGRTAARVLAAAILLIGGSLLADATADRFQVDRLGTEQVTSTLDLTAEKTAQGGSTFRPARIDSPVDVPLAAATVLFRPLPGEASGLDGMLSGVEGLALAGLLAVSLPNLVAAGRDLRRHPYLLYALGFVLSFTYAFSVIGNFGILARQRTQLLPLLFVLVAMPAVARTSPWSRRPTMRPADRPSPRQARAASPAGPRHVAPPATATARRHPDQQHDERPDPGARRAGARRR